MMKHILCITFCLFSFSAAAQNADVPMMTFGQKVEIVVDAKRDANILDMQINQKKNIIDMDVVVDRSFDREKVKTMATNLIILAKRKSLDDPPTKRTEPGPGLYNYRVTIVRPDGVVLITALKPKKKSTVHYQDPFVSEPLTRAGANAR
jgi:hypothetical protein